MSIFVTTAVYGLARELGAKDAENEFSRQIAQPSRDVLPVVRTIHRLRDVDELSLRVDYTASNVAKMRSRHAHAFLSSDADVWVTCDDDVEADVVTLLGLVAAVRSAVGGGVCIAPCLLRERSIVNVLLGRGSERKVGWRNASHRLLDRALEGDGRLVQVARSHGHDAPESVLLPGVGGGFGLVAMHRSAIEATISAHPELSFLDDDGETKSALFHEALDGGRWLGEDLSFFHRLPEETTLEVLATGQTAHNGAILNLGDWAGIARREQETEHVE